MISSINAATTTDFEKTISDYHQHYLTSATFLIAKEDHILFKQNVGLANYVTQQPFTDNTPFPVASITKQFTAAAILLLQEQNKLDLHTPIIHYLKASHPIWQGKVPDWAHEITIHHLLTHSSGLVDYSDEKWQNTFAISDQELVPFIITHIKNQPVRFKAGEKFEYNNTGYLLLSEIIETVSPEKSLSLFLANHIFQPLKMNHTYLPTFKEERAYIANVISGKHPIVRHIANLSNPKHPPQPMNELHLEVPLQGGGALFSTTQDLLKWTQGLFGGKLLSPQSLKLMVTPHISGEMSFFGPIQYGYGLFVNNDNPNDIIYFHGGWIQGIRGQLSYAPQSKISVICLSNLSPDESQDEQAMKDQINSFLNLANDLQAIAAS
ncbi:serine hydrolase [Candidatus Berkiella aquae]|uniref:Beta-lactamase family protein n=1 Tax=Candidatus Berkiella aquae TaxID=295108 RepID=A0A0Q9YW31_9GAMM|nr:serine hydrolase domain-containing protein [Candidatus Berkiella aquae]MCS5711380.1 beta-lactamase family protein [Candidatus Berkiella aquae]